MCIVAPEEVPRYKTANMAVMNFFIKNLKQKYSYFKVNRFIISWSFYILMTFTYLQQSFLRTKMALNSRHNRFLTDLIIIILQHYYEHYPTHADHQRIFNNGNGAHGQIKYIAQAGTFNFTFIENGLQHTNYAY